MSISFRCVWETKSESKSTDWTHQLNQRLDCLLLNLGKVFGTWLGIYDLVCLVLDLEFTMWFAWYLTWKIYDSFYSCDCLISMVLPVFSFFGGRTIFLLGVFFWGEFHEWNSFELSLVFHFFSWKEIWSSKMKKFEIDSLDENFWSEIKFQQS